MALISWATHVLQWPVQSGCEAAMWSKTHKAGLSSDWSLKLDLHEGGIASNRASAWRGEYVPGPCTHRPSHHSELGVPEVARLTF